jgi:predicted nucleotidyltransferase
MTTTDPILHRFRHALDVAYGERIERIILFGSRARGDAKPDADYDVAIFLKNMTDRWQEFDRLLPIVTNILYTDFAFIHAMPYGEKAYDMHTPLMHEIRREGVDL